MREKQCDDMEIDENVKTIVLNQQDRQINLSKFIKLIIGKSISMKLQYQIH